MLRVTVVSRKTMEVIGERYEPGPEPSKEALMELSRIFLKKFISEQSELHKEVNCCITQ